MAKALIVDDAAFMRITIKNALLKNGYEVVGEAENGVVAVEKYKELRPDVVTMDITMPEMSGLDALKAIVALDSKAQIIMISAMGQESMVRDAILSAPRGSSSNPSRRTACCPHCGRSAELSFHGGSSVRTSTRLY
jgi:two-component system chemotaxis response regulator CheY